jgi:hypothetical protein
LVTIWRDAGIAAHPNRHIAPAFLIEEQFGSVAIGPVEETGINAMADEHTIPPYAPDEVDASVGARAAETVKSAAKGVGAAIKQSRKPGMPLDILANATREAPLGALLAAFLLGVIVARR